MGDKLKIAVIVILIVSYGCVYDAFVDAVRAHSLSYSCITGVASVVVMAFAVTFGFMGEETHD